jgi:hypothetical protein
VLSEALERPAHGIRVIEVPAARDGRRDLEARLSELA